MRRLPALLFAAAALAACSSGGGGSAASSTSTTAADVPPALADFLRAVKPPGTVAFTATYHVTKNHGGTETDVSVTVTPPSYEIRAGDVVVHGPNVSTSDEARLSAVGVFSNFFSTGPTRELETAARRAMAGAPTFTDRVAAGVTLRCAGIPSAGVVADTACLTPEGVYGFVDNVSVRYELTSYRPGP